MADDLTPAVQSFVLVHASFGAVALLSGAVAMFTRKGSPAHVRSGRVFGLSMAVALGLALPAIAARTNMLLLFVGMFTAWLVVRGGLAFRAARAQGYGALDRAVAWGGFGAGLALIALGAWGAAVDGGFMGLGGVSLGFGVLALLLAQADLRRMQEVPDRASALRTHIASMGGAYIAASTAFVVVNLSQVMGDAGVPPVVVWLAPTAIGVPLIRRSTARYAPRAAGALAG